ncbi:MAG: terminase family protein, partial [Anaerolineae bacterium]|nr:terminase family protein [Anaerolineae bacterium]
MAVTTIKPQPGPQERFLATPADIAIFGGAAGGGKSYGLLLEALRHIGNPNFGAVILRRTFPQIRNEGGLWDTASELYSQVGGKPKETTLEWSFPSGASVRFAHLNYEADKYDWQGSQVPFFGWDELTHFTEGQFFYMLSRNRSLCGVRPYIRATTNPDADSWVAELLAWWIDQESGFPIQTRSGALRWFVRVNDDLVWADTAAELQARYPLIPPKSLTFIPARLQDNAILMREDPGYLANLLALTPLERGRLLDGNWKIRATAGKVFNRGWFEIVEAAPAGGLTCRFWDFASTEKALAKDDPDFTA